MPGWRRRGGFRVGKLFGKKHLKIFSPCPLLSASRMRSVAQRLGDPRRRGFKPLLVYHGPGIRTITTYPARPTVELSHRLLRATTDVFHSFRPSCNTHAQNARATPRTESSRSNGVCYVTHSNGNQIRFRRVTPIILPALRRATT